MPSAQRRLPTPTVLPHLLVLLLLPLLLLLLAGAEAASAAAPPPPPPQPRTLDLNASTNLVIYWGQDSLGTEASLSAVCDDPSYDVINLSYINQYSNFSTQPLLHLSTHCHSSVNCTQLSADIAHCQSVGKTVLLTLGSADHPDHRPNFRQFGRC